MLPFFQRSFIKAFGNEGNQTEHFGGNAGDNAGGLWGLANAGAGGGVAEGILGAGGAGTTTWSGGVGWGQDKLTAADIAQIESASVLVKQHAAFAFGLGWLQAFVEPTNFLVPAKLKLPAGADGPALKNLAVPLRKKCDQIADTNSIFFVEHRRFVALGDEAAKLESGMRGTRFGQVAARAICVFGGIP